MNRGALILSVAAVAAAAASAQTSPRVLPAPSFSARGHLEGLVASGSRVAVVAADDVAGCVIRVASLAGKTKPATTTAALPCREDRDGSDAFVADLWLGRTALAATVIYSPSPHGDTYSLWTGPLHGPLRRLGNEWGWTDSDVPMGFGCAWAVAAGGGVIATTQVPNRLAVEQGLEENPACPGRATTQITLNGAARPQTVVEGSWTLLATDGKRLALARLDERGLPTGELLFVCTMTRGGSAPRQLKRTGYAVGSSGSRVLPMNQGVAAAAQSARPVTARSHRHRKPQRGPTASRTPNQANSNARPARERRRSLSRTRTHSNAASPDC